MSPERTVSHRRVVAWPTIVLFIVSVAAASRLLLWAVGMGTLDRVGRDVLYQAGTLAFNYFEFGAVRRGLGGSIAWLLSRDPAVAALAFHTLFAVLVAAIATALYSRVEAPATARATIGLVLVALMYRWGDDAGRTDLAIVALLGSSALAYTNNRPVMAAFFIGLGLFIHESSLIFGLPLLVALAARPGWDRARASRHVAAAGVLVAALLLYAALDLLPHATRREMVLTIRSRLPIHEHVDWALYFALSGMRGVWASVCQNRTDPSYWVHPASGLVVTALTGFAVLGPKWSPNWGRAMMAALPGFVFLSLVANDISRWTLFACFNVWLVGVTVGEPRDHAGGRAPESGRWRLSRLAVALLLLPLLGYRASTIEYRIYAPSPVLEAVVRRLGGPRTPSVEEALERCDPHWTDVLYLP